MSGWLKVCFFVTFLVGQLDVNNSVIVNNKAVAVNVAWFVAVNVALFVAGWT